MHAPEEKSASGTTEYLTPISATTSDSIVLGANHTKPRRRRTYLLAFCLLLVGGWALLQPRGEKPPRVLQVLIWSDYISPEVIAKFENQENCKIRIETYSSNEELKEMLYDARFPNADVVVPSSYQLDSLKNMGFLLPLDGRLLRNRIEIDAQFTTTYDLDKYNDVAVPYFAAPTGLAFARSVFPNDPAARAGLIHKLSWRDIGRQLSDGTRKEGHYTLLNDKREAIAAALIASGRSPLNPTEADLETAGILLLAWCNAGLRFDSRAYQYNLYNGRSRIAQAYVGDIIPLGDKLEFALPAEAFVITCDYLAILKRGRHPDLAHRFINYLCAPETSARNMQWTLYRAPNSAALAKVSNLLKKVPVLGFLGADWAKGGVVLQPLNEREEKLYDKVWANLKEFQIE